MRPGRASASNRRMSTESTRAFDSHAFVGRRESPRRECLVNAHTRWSPSTMGAVVPPRAPTTTVVFGDLSRSRTTASSASARQPRTVPAQSPATRLGPDQAEELAGFWTTASAITSSCTDPPTTLVNLYQRLEPTVVLVDARVHAECQGTSSSRTPRTMTNATATLPSDTRTLRGVRVPPWRIEATALRRARRRRAPGQLAAEQADRLVHEHRRQRGPPPGPRDRRSRTARRRAPAPSPASRVKHDHREHRAASRSRAMLNRSFTPTLFAVESQCRYDVPTTAADAERRAGAGTARG